MLLCDFYQDKHTMIAIHTTLFQYPLICTKLYMKITTKLKQKKDT